MSVRRWSAILELHDTEASYVTDLTAVVEGYLKTLSADVRTSCIATEDRNESKSKSQSKTPYTCAPDRDIRRCLKP